VSRAAAAALDRVEQGLVPDGMIRRPSDPD
jgi:hypothetical protein